jgi:hypothetical protein
MRKYVGDGIQKMIYLIHNIWDLAQGSTNFSTRIVHFREYLQKDLENDKGFYKEFVGTFVAQASSLRKNHKREQNLPSSI